MIEVPLNSICEINPKISIGIKDDNQCSFIPMKYIDDFSGVIPKSDTRCVADVRRGYTFFQEYDVLFAKITPCMENGKCAIAKNLINGIGFGSTEFHVVRAGERVIPQWIFYFLRQDIIRKQAAHWFRGTAGQQRVPSEFLGQLEIPLPSITEQKRITAILEKADRLHRLCRYTQDLSDIFLQSVFLEMFGDPVANPMGWDETTLGNIITKGPTNGLYKSSEYIGSGVLLFDIKGLYNGFKADFSSSRRIEVSKIEMEKYAIESGDVLINRVSKMVEGVGKAVLVEDVPEPSVYESNMMRIQIDTQRVDSWYLIYFLSSNASRSELISMANISNQANINQPILKAISLLLPPLSVQKEFTKIVWRYERIRSQQYEALRQAENLFQSLLHQAFQRKL